MAEKSILWTTGGAGDGASTYTMDDLLKWMRDLFIRDQPTLYYVLAGVGSELLVSVSGGNVSVGSGAANVYGFPYYNTAAVVLTVGTPVVGTTGYRVVLKADWTARTVRIALKSGTDGSATPPALVQTPGTTYEVSLCTFTKTTGGVITLTDTRGFAWFADKLGAGAVHANSVLAANIVDDTNINNRVVMAKKRRGGSATNWTTGGTTNYDLTQVKQVFVSQDLTVLAGNKSATVDISLPENFNLSQPPVAFASLTDLAATGTAYEVATVVVYLTTINSVRVYVTRGNPASTAAAYTVTVHLLVMGAV